MTFKQKSIFEEPVKVRPQKHQQKVDDVVPLEDSIFAKKKKSKVTVYSDDKHYFSIEDTLFCQKTEEKSDDDEDTKFNLRDDEIPFEDSIFAKKKKTVSCSKVLSKDLKVDYEALFNKYKDLYTMESIYNTKSLNTVDANTFNTSCMNLEESKKIVGIMDIELYNIVKRVIKSTCTCVNDVFHSYINMNATLLRLISELHPEVNTFTIYQILDRSYAEVIEDFERKCECKCEVK